MTTSQLETPSGKGAADENFPVGSWLLPAALRPHIAIFYAFARAADDIADNPALPADEKIRRLDAFDRVLAGAGDAMDGLEKAARMRESLARTGVSPRHCHDLLKAFKQDAIRARYADWDDLMAYCNLSAAPVCRYLLDLHGEDAADYPPSDALCNALQVINHLQDCAEDYRRLDRVYLPAPAIESAGGQVADLARDTASPAIRLVIDDLLARTDELLDAAGELPGRLRSTRLAMESATILRLARRLTRRLGREDPLARRVRLRPWAVGTSAVEGILWGLSRAGRGGPAAGHARH